MRKQMQILAVALVAVLTQLVLTGCKPSVDSSQASDTAGLPPGAQTYPSRGVIKELIDDTTARIAHEEVPDFMPAMTMVLSVKDPAELENLSVGDTVTFRFVMTDTDSWIDQVERVEEAAAAAQPAPKPTVRIVRDVEELEVGDTLPAYTLTNHLGQAFSTDELRGTPYAFTFIFTRCPLPQYCPRMSSNFSEVQSKLKARADAPAQWRLYSISFDPEFDTPPVLKSHADAFGADPDRWQFATGSLIDITALGEQFGLMFWTKEGTIEHNLRTVVMDPQGRVHQIFIGNEWSPNEVVESLVEASKQTVESEA